MFCSSGVYLKPLGVNKHIYASINWRMTIMKKKLIAILLVAVMAVGVALALTGCKPNYVNTSGSYKEATKEELTAAFENVDINVLYTDTINVYYYLNADASGTLLGENYETKLKMEMDGIIKYDATNPALNIDCNMDLYAKAGNQEDSKKENFNMYMDTEYIYVRNNDSKFKVSVMYDDLLPSVPSVDIDDFLTEVSAKFDDYKCSIAESGKTKKIKFELSYTDLDMGDSSVPIGADFPIEFYIVIEDNNVIGLKVSGSGKVNVDDMSVNIEINFQIGHTNKSVPVPNDLDDYEYNSSLS